MPRTYHSKYREWITQWFTAHPDDRLSAGALYSLMSSQGIQINTATVYRNLERLAGEGVLLSQKGPADTEVSYQYAAPDRSCAHHLHLVCRKCGRVSHLNCRFMDQISDHLLADHGFLIDCSASVISGLCAECQKSADPYSKEGKE